MIKKIFSQRIFLLFTVIFLCMECSVVDLYARRMKKKSKIINSRTQQCHSFIRQNKLDEALKCATLLVIDYPKNAKVYSLRGQVYFIKGEYKIALKDINQAISMKPKDSSFYGLRGIIKYKTGDFLTAIEDFSRSIKLNSKTAGTYRWRSSTYEMLGKHKEALSDINKYIKMMPKVSDGYFRRARINYEEKRMEESLADCYMAIALDSKNISAIDLKGSIYLMRGEFNKALAEYNRVIELSPKTSKSYSNRGLVYWLQGKRKEAIEDMKKAIKLFPKLFPSYYHLGYFMHQENNKKIAKSYFLRAYELFPKLLQNRENILGSAIAPQVIRYYKKELFVAKEYLLSSGKYLYIGKTNLEVKSIHTKPKRIRVGKKFIIAIKYMVSDPSVNSEKLQVYMNFRIIKGEKVLFKSGSIALESKNSVENTRYQNMNPYQRKGSFNIEVTLTYKDKTSSKTIAINIS